MSINKNMAGFGRPFALILALPLTLWQGGLFAGMPETPISRLPPPRPEPTREAVLADGTPRESGNTHRWTEYSPWTATNTAHGSDVYGPTALATDRWPNLDRFTGASGASVQRIREE